MTIKNTVIATALIAAVATSGLASAGVGPVRSQVDFNGDGFDDAFMYDKSGPKGIAKVNCLGVDGNGLPTLVGQDLISKTWRETWEVHTGDFDGDGRDDVFLYDRDDVKGVAHLIRFDDTCNTISSKTVADQWRLTWDVTIGDFDGDGRDDVFLYDNTGPKGVAHLVRFDTNGDIYSSHPVADLWRTTWEVQSGDFDGDGWEDILLFDRTVSDAVAHLVRFDHNGNIFSSHIIADDWNPGYQLFPGDFDGDGTTDIFLYDNTLAKGLAELVKIGPTAYITSHETLSSTWRTTWEVLPSDLNGDDIADLLLVDDNGMATTLHHIIFNSNGRIALSQIVTDMEESGLEFYMGDFTGDGRGDVLRFDRAYGEADVGVFKGSSRYSHRPVFEVDAGSAWEINGAN